MYQKSMFGLAAVAAMLVAVDGHATLEVAAEAGRTDSFTDLQYFSGGYGGVTYTGTGTRDWNVQLPVNSDTAANVNVSAYVTTDSNGEGVECVTYSETTYSGAHGTFYYTSWTAPPDTGMVFGQFSGVVALTQYVPQYGSLQSTCQLDNGAAYWNVRWGY
jgi:hypothetical protein